MFDTYGYTLADADHYAPPGQVADPGHRYIPSLLPFGWTDSTRDIWTVWTMPGLRTPDQGWKIHVSARLDRADAVLDEVARVCFAQQVPFKHLSAELFFLFQNHKHGSRTQSGKFCVAYPPDSQSARRLLVRLTDALAAEEGPYILSDRRYRDSRTVHYRFGAFSCRSRQRPNGTVEWLVRDAYGRDTADVVRPSFVLPQGIADPFVDRAVTVHRGAVVLRGYEIVRAIQLTNAGGTYEARHARTGRKVFVKEARANAGLSWDGRNAQQRLRREHELLVAIDREEPEACPAPLDYFAEWEHEFLVTEFVEGVPLSRWVAQRSPHLLAGPGAGDFASYYSDCAGVLADLDRALDRLHALGYRFGDVSPANVLVSAEGRARLVDFEAASGGEESGPVARDEYGLAELALSLLTPPHRVAERSPGNLRLVRRDLERVAPVPDWLWQRATRFFPTADTVPASLPQPRDLDLRPLESLQDFEAAVRRAILAMADPGHPDRVFPTTPRGYRSNTTCVAHGTAGVLHALHVTGTELPADVVERFRLDAVGQRAELPPGLHVGSAGVSWVLAELGLFEEAADLLAAADRHPVAPVSTTLGEGLAGIGMAYLAMYHHTADQRFLDRAAAAGDAIVGTVDLGLTLGDHDAVGLLRGRAGLALFLYYLARDTGEAAYREAGRGLLHADLDRALTRPDGTLSFPADAATRHATPYLYAGTAGMTTVVTRYAATAPDDRLVEALPPMLGDITRTCVSTPALYRGLAGLAFGLAEHADWAGGPDHHTDAVRVATGLVKYAIPAHDGVRFLGDGSMRYSAELWSGGGGVLLAVHRVVHGAADQFFTLDDPQLHRLTRRADPQGPAVPSPAGRGTTDTLGDDPLRRGAR